MSASPALSYAEFLEHRTQLDGMAGFEPLWIPDFLFGFQQEMTAWSIRMGRSVARRVVDMRTNPGETALTAFMGVGSEAYAAVELGRPAIGIELKTSYYRQAVKNLELLEAEKPEQLDLGLEAS